MELAWNIFLILGAIFGFSFGSVAIVYCLDKLCNAVEFD